jgi:hypothetical protein
MSCQSVTILHTHEHHIRYYGTLRPDGNVTWLGVNGRNGASNNGHETCS